MDQVTPPDASVDEQQLVQITALARRLASRYMSRDDAEDLAQDVVFDALLQMQEGRWEIRVALEAWCCHVVSRRVIDARRRRRRHERLGAEYEKALVAQPRVWMQADAEVELAEQQGFYERTVAALPPACRRVWLMVREGNASYDAVARELGVTRSAVCSQIVIAGRRFRKELQAEERGRALAATEQGDNRTRTRKGSTRRVREAVR